MGLLSAERRRSGRSFLALSCLDNDESSDADGRMQTLQMLGSYEISHLKILLDYPIIAHSNVQFDRHIRSTVDLFLLIIDLSWYTGNHFGIQRLQMWTMMKSGSLSGICRFGKAGRF